ncbi:hypothetical protein [Chitinibacter sp. GC72]|uniref:hypothetical protein n=1 Tax=Chitinibacter sp. GC72 TaxID=1526917 RepID=UPI0018E04431|nr:hypothetical protein [Chitinibacter sp. GC72]
MEMITYFQVEACLPYLADLALWRKLAYSFYDYQFFHADIGVFSSNAVDIFIEKLN